MSLENNMNFMAARRILAGPNPWLVDLYSINHNKLQIQGWAISGYEEPQNYTFKINGAPVKDVKMGLPSDNLARVFPFFSGSGNSRFCLNHELTEYDINLGYAAIQYCNVYTLDPIYDWHTIYIPLKTDDNACLPSEEQLQRTQGNTCKLRYIIYGYTTYRRIESMLYLYFRKSFCDFSRILDWGCGCGRVSRLLVNLGPQIYGCDIDPPNIDYCSENIDGGTFDVIKQMPPTLYPDEYFNLIIGISVFTHLTGEATEAWVSEISRILKPGGIVLLTVHGNSAIARFKEDSKLKEVFSTGFLDRDVDHALDKIIADKSYYRSTYHLASRVRHDFSSHFRVIDIIRASNALLQDFVVLEKK